MNQVTATVIKNDQVLNELERPQARDITGSWVIWLRCPGLAHDAQPGQFVMLHCGQERTLPRPFSIHQLNDEGDIALFFAAWKDGRGTHWLSQRKIGDTVGLLGPLGNGFTVNSQARNLLLVAGGIGIAPLRFLAEQGKGNGYNVKLIRGASAAVKPSGKSNPPQHYPEELLPGGIEVKSISTTPDGRKGMVTELIPEFAGWADQVFACGPTAMYRDMALRKKELGLEGKPVQVSLETRMGCGRGVCYSCTVRTKHGLKQVCQDGPVFDLDDIIWDELMPS